MNINPIIKRPPSVLELLLAFVIGAIQTAVAAIDYTYTLDESTLRLDTVKSPSGVDFIKISGDKFWSDGNPGEPELPYTVIRFLVPDNASDFSVSTTGFRGITTINPDIKLYPVQEMFSMNEYRSDFFTYPDVKKYETYLFEFSAEVLEDSHIEGRFHVVTIALKPFSYNGESNSLKMCQDMDIRLEYREYTSSCNKKENDNKTGIIDISNIVVNPPLSKEDTDKSGFSALLSAPKPYYIISERSLLEALQDFAAWKTQKGYQVVMKAIEDVYEDSRYKIDTTTEIVDEAASLRKYLQDEYDEHGCFFCLLVGDHKTRMPIRKVQNGSSTNPNGDNYIPTDDYFSDLLDNWNHIWDEKNGFYVCPVVSPFAPDIYVGRLLCHSKEEISNYTSKLILYESNPGRGKADYLEKTSISVQHDAALYEILGESCYKMVLDKMETTFPSVNCILDCAIIDENTYGSPTGTEILEALNTNGYCSLIGHGEPSTIACSGKHYPTSRWEYIKALESYSYNTDKSLAQTNIDHPTCNNGLDLLTNFDSPSVIYSFSCTTCPFDIYKSPSLTFDLPHTMASSFTVGGRYGGVAYLGNTRSGYFTYSPQLEVLFLANIKRNRQIGVAEAMSKYEYTMSNLVRHTHNLIGDPELEMWLTKPSELKIGMQWQPNCIMFSKPVKSDCKIVVNDGEGNLRTYNNDFASLISIPYINTSDNMVSVGIFKSGCLPVVKLGCSGQYITNCNKRFVVRDALLGIEDDGSSSIIIGRNASVSIYAVDKAECGDKLSVQNQGVLSIESDKDVVLEGCTIETAGKLNVKCEKVYISNGFSVDFGASLSINLNNN